MSDARAPEDLIHDARNKLTVARATIEAFIDGKLTPSPERLSAVLQSLNELDSLIQRVSQAARSHKPEVA